jgi:methionyl-tRNA formyltransferase
MAPKPGAFTTWQGEPLRILAAHAEPDRCDDPPGTVRVAADGAVRVATGRGWLVPTRLQRAGARPLDVADLQRGRGLADGERLDGCGGGARRRPSDRTGRAARLR